MCAVGGSIDAYGHHCTHPADPPIDWRAGPQGVKFVSETDTEVIAQLIGQGLDQNLNLRDATENALKR